MEIFVDKKQRELHIKMLLHIAHLGGEITSSEAEFVSALAKIYGVSDGFVESETAIIKERPKEYSDEILRSLEVPLEEKQKRCLLQDTIALSCADGDFCDDEISFVKVLAHKLKIDENISSKILDLNLKSMQLSKQLANTLLISDR